MLTVIFAVYAVAVVITLLLAGHLSDWFGRRRTLLPAGAFIVASALVFVMWKGLARSSPASLPSGSWTLLRCPPSCFSL